MPDLLCCSVPSWISESCLKLFEMSMFRLDLGHICNNNKKNIYWCMPDYITSGFHQDSDLLDRRKHCFGVQSESGEDLYFSVELESDLALWEKAFQTATFLEVERIQVRTTALMITFWYINRLWQSKDLNEEILCSYGTLKSLLLKKNLSKK